VGIVILRKAEEILSEKFDEREKKRKGKERIGSVEKVR
jgi:hypothetical protein